MEKGTLRRPFFWEVGQILKESIIKEIQALQIQRKTLSTSAAKELYESKSDRLKKYSAFRSNYSFFLNEIGSAADVLENYRNWAVEPCSEAECINYANALRYQKKISQARTWYSKSQTFDTSFKTGVALNLAVLLLEEGSNKEAFNEFSRLAREHPDLSEAWLNLAVIASKEGANSDALEYMESYNRIVNSPSLNAVLVESFAASKMKRVKHAMQILQGWQAGRAYSEMPATFLLALLRTAQKGGFFEIADEVGRLLPGIIEETSDAVDESYLFGFLACPHVNSEQLLKSARVVAAKIGNTVPQVSEEDGSMANAIESPRENNEKIRIGIMSADFRDHPMAHLMLPIYNLLNRDKFEVFAFNLFGFDNSYYHHRCVLALENFIDCSAMSATDIAKKMRTHNLDILLDLVGYTEGCKPQIVEMKPARKIVSYLGFVSTSGLKGMDYIIGDPVVFGYGSQQWYSERQVHLSKCYLPTDPTLPIVEANRSKLGIDEGVFIYGALNNTYKLNLETISAWSHVLLAVANSVLLIYSDSDNFDDQVISYLTQHGIHQSRIYFFRRDTKRGFLAALATIDLFLDTFPYNGGTTVSDSLFVGTPVVTRFGSSFSSRMALSLLTHLGLEEFACDSFDRYIDLAIAYANDASLRTKTLSKLRDNRSKLFDVGFHCAVLERAFIAIAKEEDDSVQSPLVIDFDETRTTQVACIGSKGFASKEFSRGELDALSRRLESIYGVEEKNALLKEMIPANQTANHKINMDSDKMTENQFENDELKNFFNPIFWGVKDPDIFANLLKILTTQTNGYHFSDNMFTFQRNNSMLTDDHFMSVWKDNIVSPNDGAIIWRRYILCMAAHHCANLEGDFVECGAYEGVGAKVVIDYLGDYFKNKTFWLYDLFEHDSSLDNHSMPNHGPELYKSVQHRFDSYNNVRVEKGFIPDVYESNGAPEKIAYLHIDLNQAPAEIATLEALFDRVVPGGVIIFDDYEMLFYRAQKLAEDKWLGDRGYKVFPLPTSQGLVIKR